jgi:NitT/TauT family transport system permease protein
MYKMSLDGSLFYHVGITLFETIIGFVTGTLLGTFIAILLWWNDYISKTLEPYLVILNSLPKTALAQILIVWVGNNMKFIVTILTVWNGFLGVDKDKIKLIKTFGGTKIQILTKVILPASVPTIINALKVNVGLSFVGVIVGEFLVASAGLGYLIVYGSQIFKLDWVMMSVIILSILSAILYRFIVILEHNFLKWRQ